MSRIRFLLLILFLSISHTQALEIKIIAYNALLQQGPLGFLNYKHYRKKFLLEKIIQNDIIGLTEVSDKKIIKNYLKKTSKSHPYFYKSKNAKGLFKNNGGLLILSKFPIIQKKQIIFKSATGFDHLVQKGALFVRLKVSTDHFIDVVLTHMQAHKKNKHIKVRKNQLREISQLIQENNKKNPLILMGDFNIVGDSKEYQSFKSIFPEYTDLYRYHYNDEGYTYDSNSNPLAFGNVRLRLDYIWINDQVNPHDTTIKINPISLNRPERKVDFLSDHFALEATIHLKHYHQRTGSY